MAHDGRPCRVLRNSKTPINLARSSDPSRRETDHVELLLDHPPEFLRDKRLHPINPLVPLLVRVQIKPRARPEIPIGLFAVDIGSSGGGVGEDEREVVVGGGSEEV
jgi:hypothetical protein